MRYCDGHRMSPNCKAVIRIFRNLKAINNMETPNIDGIDERKLSEGESNVLSVLKNLPVKQFNSLKERFGLSHPGFLGQMTLDAFVHFSKTKNIDISTAGVRKFKQENRLTDTGVFEGKIGPTTAMAYYEQLSKKEANPNQELAHFAAAYVGVQESGKNKGSEVEMFQKAVDGRASGEPWCMGFVQYCIKAVDGTSNQVNSRVVSSEGCLDVWNRSPHDLRIAVPEMGCLVIWRHGQTERGHVGIVESVKPGHKQFVTIEGNTGAGAGVQREGDGVYRKNRDLDGDGKMKVVGFLRVF